MMLRRALGIMILVGLLVGVLLGFLLLRPRVGPYPSFRPEVSLVYFYFRLLNASSYSGLNKIRFISFMTVLKIFNPYRGIYFSLSSVRVALPQQIYYVVENGTIMSGSGEIPTSSLEVIKVLNRTGGYGFSNDLLFNEGVNYFPPRDTGYLIPEGMEVYVIVSGVVPLPSHIAEDLSGWIHGGGWGYVFLSIEGEALSKHLEVKGIMDYACFLKVRFSNEGSEYWFGSLPKLVIQNPDERVVLIPPVGSVEP